ncbi:epoxyqueuosine reductase QueH [Desulfonatronum parangueonense]
MSGTIQCRNQCRPSEKLLLHICCGPCALIPVRELRSEGLDPDGLFYNPNIHGVSEYLQRRETLQQAARRLNLRITCLDDEYDPRRFFQAVAGRDDDRCPYCYRLRLERTFQFARQHGYSCVSTTLLYSKYQNREAILTAGRELQDRTGIRFLGRDFRPGWQEGVDLSRQWELYRQPYCGCLYSELDRRRKVLRRLAAQSAASPDAS